MCFVYLRIQPAIARFAVVVCLCLLGQTAAWAQGAAGVEPSASGLLIGLKPGVNEVLADQLDSGPESRDRLRQSTGCLTSVRSLSSIVRMSSLRNASTA